MLMVMNTEMRKLGREIEKALAGRSQSWLARKSGVGQPTISRLIRGQVKPTPKTLEALANALGLDPLRFMKLAGIPLPLSSEELDPATMHIAQRIAKLPAIPRELAINTIGNMLDAIYQLYFQKAEEAPQKPEVRAVWASEELVPAVTELAERLSKLAELPKENQEQAAEVLNMQLQALLNAWTGKDKVIAAQNEP